MNAQMQLSSSERRVCSSLCGVVLIHAGYYKGKQISIVAVGMGSPMMEVLVREASYITQGPLAIVRLGKEFCMPLRST